MPYVMVDVEADGPIPGDYSMISLGAVIVAPQLDRTFYGQLKPISDKFVAEALAVSGFTREQTLAFDDPESVMTAFRDWLKVNCRGRCMFISDNNGFDWQPSLTNRLWNPIRRRIIDAATPSGICLTNERDCPCGVRGDSCCERRNTL